MARDIVYGPDGQKYDRSKPGRPPGWYADGATKPAAKKKTFQKVVTPAPKRQAASGKRFVRKPKPPVQTTIPGTEAPVKQSEGMVSVAVMTQLFELQNKLAGLEHALGAQLRYAGDVGTLAGRIQNDVHVALNGYRERLGACEAEIRRLNGKAAATQHPGLTDALKRQECTGSALIGAGSASTIPPGQLMAEDIAKDDSDLVSCEVDESTETEEVETRPRKSWKGSHATLASN